MTDWVKLATEEIPQTPNPPTDNTAISGKQQPATAEKAPDNEAEALLRKHPNLTHAFVPIDTDDPDYEHVVVAIRDKATCVLRIPREKYDGMAMLQWIENTVTATRND
jgi:hypothetical protein